jgi:hypothetical protein
VSTIGRSAAAGRAGDSGRLSDPVAAGGRRPRVAEVWPARPQPSVRPATTPSYATGSAAAPGAAAGRAAAATLPMQPAPPQRRLALAVLAVLALLAAVGGIFAVVHRPREKTDATPPPPAVPATLFYTTPPARSAPTTQATTTPPSRSPSPAATLSFDDALARLQATVEQAKIRDDVRLDLLNLIRPLNNPDDKNVKRQLKAIRGKINERAGEGTLSPAQAIAMRARVTDLDRAVGV